MAASRVQQLLCKVKAAVQPTAELVGKQVFSRYEQLMADNAQYVVKDKSAADKLLKQYVFTQLARIPPGIAHAKEEAAVLRHKLGQLQELPTTEVAIYAGFLAELYAWFCIGEIVGRGGSLTGYTV